MDLKQKVIDASQELFLQSGCLYPDSKVIQEPNHWILSTHSCKERWANAIIRADNVHRALEHFPDSHHNFVWHNWDCFTQFEPTQLTLAKLNFHKVGVCVCLLADPTSPHKEHRAISWEWLSKDNLETFCNLKAIGWNVPDPLRCELHSIIQRHLNNPNHRGLILLSDGVPCAAGNIYLDGNWAYLRGDCVLPKFRKQGLYQKFIQLRQKILQSEGVSNIVTLADESTSAKSFVACQFKEVSKFHIWSRRPGPWLSP